MWLSVGIGEPTVSRTYHLLCPHELTSDDLRANTGEGAHHTYIDLQLMRETLSIQSVTQGLEALCFWWQVALHTHR